TSLPTEQLMRLPASPFHLLPGSRDTHPLPGLCGPNHRSFAVWHRSFLPPTHRDPFAFHPHTEWLFGIQKWQKVQCFAYALAQASTDYFGLLLYIPLHTGRAKYTTISQELCCPISKSPGKSTPPFRIPHFV